jgi:hypothetical protein
MRSVPRDLAETHPEAPELLRASLAFLYVSGTAFVGDALERGGFAAIDRVHDDPPASTEQVLHPERYYTARDQPIVVTIGGTERLERAGWKRTLDDTVGELGVRVLAAARTPPTRAESIAAGWGETVSAPSHAATISCSCG